MKRFPEHQLNAKIRRTRDATALSRLGLLLFCGLVLAGGFVFAAKQHFAAVQYGYQNESLRSERKRLLEENQRLSLEKERAIAPDKLEPAARRLGIETRASRADWKTLIRQTFALIRAKVHSVLITLLVRGIQVGDVGTPRCPIKIQT